MHPLRRSVVLTLVLLTTVTLGLMLSPSATLTDLTTVMNRSWFPVFLLGLYLVRPLLAWPITAISVLVGYRYGLVTGLPIALGGAVLTSCIPYAAARYFRTDAGWIGRATNISERFFDATGPLRGIIAARLAPTPAEPISIAAGMARIPLWVFAVGTVVGELPWTIAAVLAGASMHRLALVGFDIDPRLGVIGLFFGLLLLAGPIYRYWQQRERVA